MVKLIRLRAIPAASRIRQTASLGKLHRVLAFGLSNGTAIALASFAGLSIRGACRLYT